MTALDIIGFINNLLCCFSFNNKHTHLR